MQKFYRLQVLFFIFLTGWSFLSARSFEQKVIDLHNDETISSDSLYTIFKTESDYIQPRELDVLIKDYHVISDTLRAPFFYHLPAGYDSEVKNPLLISLHGGVSREEFITDYEDSIIQSPFLAFTEERGWITLFPQGNIHTTWWSETGMYNIKYQIRYLKEKYNVDDDRVYLTGFSDGGSAAYHFGLLDPQDFAAFYPLSGNMLVGSVVEDVPVYTPNLSNRHVRAVNTDLDRLYPAKRMRLMVELAQQMGADIFYLEYWDIGHSYDYGKMDLPRMFADMEKQTRNIFQPSVRWETADTRWGRSDWLEIVEIDTLRIKKDWHEHKTLLLPDDRVVFGFMEDIDHDVDGVRVGTVTEGSASDEMGLLSGDVIIAMDGIFIDTINDLLALRDEKERGDAFTLTVLRAGKEIILPGAFPPVTHQEVFEPSEQSGALKALYRANTFMIESTRVSRLAVYIHPEMINDDLPVKIIVNDEVVFHDKIRIDRQFMTDNFLDNRDRSALWTNRIQVDIP